MAPLWEQRMATADALPRRLAGRAAARSRRGRAGGVEHGDTFKQLQLQLQLQL